VKIDRKYQQKSEQVCFGGGHGLFGIIPAAPLLPGKMIAYFFIKNFLNVIMTITVIMGVGR